jgi:hypothetical protein
MTVALVVIGMTFGEALGKLVPISDRLTLGRRHGMTMDKRVSLPNLKAVRMILLLANHMRLDLSLGVSSRVERLDSSKDSITSKGAIPWAEEITAIFSHGIGGPI